MFGSKCSEDQLLRAPREPLAGKHTGSFAYYTIRDRLPVILTKAVDDVSRTIFDLSDEDKQRHEEGKDIIERIGAFRYELQRDRAMLPLSDDLPDVCAWNSFLEANCAGLGSFQAPWLYVECYMYRRVREAFALNRLWRDYDPFKREKEQALTKSLPVLETLGHHIATLLANASADLEKRKLPLGELLLYSLWGNAVDLSLLITADNVDMNEVSSTLIKEGTENVVVNQLDEVVNYLAGLSSKRIDFILDNAGFELAADLFLADWLISSGIANEIVFHVKDMGWFVSDTTEADFFETLRLLRPALPSFVERWEQYLKGDGARAPVWSISHDQFWTYPHSFHHLPQFPVFDKLRGSSLLIFKGDLNYRKLVFDCSWEPTTSFSEAIGPLSGNDMPPLVSLRTCKCDVCVGMTESKVQELSHVKDWMISGKFAIVSCSNMK